MSIEGPYLLFLGDLTDLRFAKTAAGLKDWAPERCVGEWRLGAGISLGLAHLSPSAAHALGARSLVIGVAPPGGCIAPSWIAPLVQAMEAGLDLVSGMHQTLASVPELQAAAQRLGRQLVEVRVPPSDISVATGRRRQGKRLLTVGTDCALGKKYTALVLARAFSDRGIEADFRATGQTGILIAGGGIPIDAVVADFIAGAAEALSPDAAETHWDVVEGQGSLFHPAFAGVTLGLLHGTQPDVIVVCHDVGRTHMLGLGAELPLPCVRETIDLALRLARRTNPDVRCAGASLNTSRLDPARAGDAIARLEQEIGLPVADPIRGGPDLDRLVSSCLA
jgi:uncharacterized NAD-dependent epimerase/dehydratase family protein